MSAVPPPLKPIVSFIKRAEELDNDKTNPDSKVVAYFCRKYAVERGIKLRDNSPDSNTYLMGLMTTLEKDKSSFTMSQEEKQLICEKFAYSVFSKADEEDRGGAADRSTAKTFYAAASFFDILEQFGELSSDVQEKRRYCKFKAADVIKAINAGLRPAIGAPGEESAPPTPPVPPIGSSDSLPYSIPSPPRDAPLVIPPAPYSTPSPPTPWPPSSAPPVPPPYSAPPPVLAPTTFVPAAPTPTPVPAHAPYNSFAPAPPSNPSASPPSFLSPTTPRSGPPTSSADPRAKDAMELAHFAIAALKHNDLNLARERLQEALRRLG